MDNYLDGDRKSVIQKMNLVYEIEVSFGARTSNVKFIFRRGSHFMEGRFFEMLCGSWIDDHTDVIKIIESF